MLKRKTWAVAGAVLGLAAVARAVLSADKSVPSNSTRTYVLERTQMIPAPVDRVFPFFEDPNNLARLTPQGMGFEILSIDGLPMRRGTTIEYRIKPLGVPQRWTTEIVEYEPNTVFVDLQRSGPYRYWRHQHLFNDEGGRTLMVDRVEYQMPLGVVGRAAHALLVARELRRIFDYRAAAIMQTFGHDHGVER